MAQSFHALSTSLGEAERQKNGKEWTKKDYENHSKKYNIEQSRTYLNTVFVSANGRNERDLVNEFLHDKMLELNDLKKQKVDDWNAQHSGKTNPKTGKEYRKKSVDKREMYPVGKYAGKGKRKLPYDVFKAWIEKGNARGKESSSSRYRTGVLQQFAVGFGNSEEWQQDGAHKYFLDEIKSGDEQRATAARDLFNEKYAKPWLEKFQKENPSMHVVQAVMHYDETDPHMQVTVLPHVEGKENGGLGSTAYTGAIKHDHPDLKGNVISAWYQSQHDALRRFITTTPSGLTAKMQIGERPGSHTSNRVDVFKKQQETLNAQKTFIEQEKANTVNESIKTIKELKPDNMVPQMRLKGHETPKKISTPEGEEQHRRQPLEWLSKTAVETIRLAVFRINQLMKQLQERQRNQEQRDREMFEAGRKAERDSHNRTKDDGLEL